MSWSISDEEFSAFPAPRPLRARPLGSLAASMIGIVAIFVLALSLLFLGKSPVEDAQRAAPIATAPVAAPAIAAAFAPREAAQAQEAAAFDLSAPELANEKKTYSVLRHKQGGGRQDTLGFGEFDGGRPYLRLDIHQAGGEKLGISDFFLDMTRHAAQAGLAVARMSQPAALASRLGAFEAADIRLSHGASEGAVSADERVCLAVRLVNPKLSLEITGLACGGGGKPIDRRAMACILDRLEYASGGENEALAQFFQKERGQACVRAAAPRGRVR